MSIKIENIISTLNSELVSLIESQKDEISHLKGKIQLLMEAISPFEDNWIGSWASEDYNYYQDFISKSRNGIVLNDSQIMEYLEKQSKSNFADIKKAIPVITKPYKTFRDRIITELSIIKGSDNLDSEILILDKLENYQWGTTSMEYIKVRRPKAIITYDPETILNKGLDTPPHIEVGATLISWFTNLVSIEGFEKNCKRILRQLELKYSMNEAPSLNSDLIYMILNSFHNVATQLRNRYSSRESLLIEDEYDVQDLLHSLLKIGYTDIRPEEYTPSYAGSSTRMDFLLRNELIVIEVKKTREGLRDKDVGDQLIIDAQHYKAHPHCKRLICFVYDPENRLRNPRGLEADLNELTSDEMIVEVLIRP